MFTAGIFTTRRSFDGKGSPEVARKIIHERSQSLGQGQGNHKPGRSAERSAGGG